VWDIFIAFFYWLYEADLPNQIQLIITEQDFKILLYPGVDLQSNVV